MMDAIASLKPAFSIYTGDVVAHDVWLVNKTEVLQDFNATYSTMESTLGLVYAALGNHDTAPLNLFPSTNVPSSYNPQWAYDALTTSWLTLTSDNPAISTAKEYGSYSARHKDTKLRIISYNSIFYYKYNFFSYEEPMPFDPDGQLSWLISELSAAEAASERVWLISHIPSGNSDHFRDHSHYFDQIVQRYEATIAGLFFGHTHTDEFQVSYSDYAHRSWDTATAMGYVAPSMTPTSGPPSFRVYEIDPVTFGVLDFTQYIADISDSAEPKWVPYYSAKKDYGSRLDVPVEEDMELTPAFWHNVTVGMEKDPSLFQDFWARRTRGFEVPRCEGDCVSKEICALRGADAQYSCVEATPGFSFEKRGERSVLLEKRFQPECNHAGMAPLLAKIAHRASLAREMEA
jgi:sphingomyelin phosphodiesterase